MGQSLWMCCMLLDFQDQFEVSWALLWLHGHFGPWARNIKPVQPWAFTTAAARKISLYVLHCCWLYPLYGWLNQLKSPCWPVQSQFNLSYTSIVSKMVVAACSSSTQCFPSKPHFMKPNPFLEQVASWLIYDHIVYNYAMIIYIYIHHKP